MEAARYLFVGITEMKALGLYGGSAISRTGWGGKPVAKVFRLFSGP